MKYEILSPNVVDVETGEVVNLSKININELNEKERIHLMASMKVFINSIRDFGGLVESRVVHELFLKEATSYKDDELKINIQNKVDYAYDTEIIEKLKNYIDEQTFEDIFKKNYKANRTKLKSLINLGGDIKKIIECGTEEKPQKPYVKIEHYK